MMFKKMDATEKMLRNLIKARADEFNDLNKSITRLEQAFLTDREAFTSLFRRLAMEPKKISEIAESIRNRAAELRSKTQIAKEKCNTALDVQKDMQTFRRLVNEQAIARVGPTFVKLQNNKQSIVDIFQNIETQLHSFDNTLIRLFITVQPDVDTPLFFDLYNKLRKTFNEWAEKTAEILVAIRAGESLVLEPYAMAFRDHRK